MQYFIIILNVFNIYNIFIFIIIISSHLLLTHTNNKKDITQNLVPKRTLVIMK